VIFLTIVVGLPLLLFSFALKKVIVAYLSQFL
jgi:hypothetical protein